MNWTPYQINIMLHYHCCVGPWPLSKAPIFPDTVGDLVSSGLLVPYDDGICPPEPHCYSTTDRGRALIEMWCSTPIPEQRFADAADQAFLHAVDVAAQRELHVDAVLRELVAKPDRHHPLGIDAGKVFEQDGCAVPAAEALAGDAHVRLLPLDRMVPEVDPPLAVLHHVMVDAAADGNHRINQRGIHVQNPVDLFRIGGEIALQPQQVPTQHAKPPNRREIEPFATACQMRAAA